MANLGVYVPEVAKYHGGGEAKSVVRECNCCVRARIGGLGPEHTDLWWISFRVRHWLARSSTGSNATAFRS